MESFPNLIARYARRTERLNTAHVAIAFALGGQADSRLADKLHLPISGDTLLSLIRDTRITLPAEPEVIGVEIRPNAGGGCMAQF